jgi:stage V sporulation protein B
MLLSAGLRNSFVIYSSDMACALMGFVSLIVVSRALGPDGFGVFTIATAIMGVAFTLSDFGLSGGTAKLASPLKNKDLVLFQRVIAESLKIRAVVSTIVLAIGALLSWLISEILIGREGAYIIVILSFVGGFATSLFTHVRVALQSERRFRILASIRVAVTGGTLAILITLILAESLSPETGIVGYAVTPLAAFTLFMMLSPKSGGETGGRPRERREILQFSKWIFAVAMLSSVFLRLDVFFLGATWTDADVGVYSVALTLIFPVTQLANSLATVLIPEVSSMKTKKELERFVLSSLRYTLPISTALILFAFTSIPDELIPWFFGKGYTESIAPFRVLVLSASAILICTPIYLVVYPLGRPIALAKGDFIKLLLHLSVYSILVPTRGVMGAAWGNASAMLIGSAISVMIVLVELRRIHPEQSF